MLFFTPEADVGPLVVPSNDTPLHTPTLLPLSPYPTPAPPAAPAPPPTAAQAPHPPEAERIPHGSKSGFTPSSQE